MVSRAWEKHSLPNNNFCYFVLHFEKEMKKGNRKHLMVGKEDGGRGGGEGAAQTKQQLVGVNGRKAHNRWFNEKRKKGEMIKWRKKIKQAGKQQLCTRSFPLWCRASWAITDLLGRAGFPLCSWVPLFCLICLSNVLINLSVFSVCKMMLQK